MTKCIAFLLYICTCKHLGGSFICSLRPFHLLSFIDVSIIWGLFPLLHPCKLSSRELSFHFLSLLPLHIWFLVLFVLCHETLLPSVAFYFVRSCLLLSSLCFTLLVLFLFLYRFLLVCLTFYLVFCMSFLLLWHFTSFHPCLASFKGIQHCHLSLWILVFFLHHVVLHCNSCHFCFFFLSSNSRKFNIWRNWEDLLKLFASSLRWLNYGGLLPTPPRGDLWACSWLLVSCMAKIGSAIPLAQWLCDHACLDIIKRSIIITLSNTVSEKFCDVVIGEGCLTERDMKEGVKHVLFIGNVLNECSVTWVSKVGYIPWTGSGPPRSPIRPTVLFPKFQTWNKKLSVSAELTMHLHYFNLQMQGDTSVSCTIVHVNCQCCSASYLRNRYLIYSLYFR